MPARRPRSIPVVLALALAACMTWKQTSEPPPAVLARHPVAVRIVRSDNAIVEIQRPQLRGDSIVGEAGGPAHSPARAAVAAADVKSLDVRGLSAGRTLGLAAGLGVTAILVAAAASPDSPSPGPVCGSTCAPSCPFVYSWTRGGWRLDSGTFGGAILPGLARTDLDNLDAAAPDGDTLRLRVANQLNETDHIDALRVVVVDHASGLAVAPGPDGALHSLGPLEQPARARDFAGRDVLARIAGVDGWAWESALALRDTTTESRDGVVLGFRRPNGAGSARLVLDGHNTPWAGYLMWTFVAAHGRETGRWYDALAADPALAGATGAAIAREAFLTVSVWAGGRWLPQGLAWEAGPEIVKRQVVPLDLRRVAGDTVLVRLESAPGLWRIDAAAIDFSAEGPLEVHQLAPARAVDRTGRDVRALLAEPDGREYLTEPGDGAELAFALPPRPAGGARSYLLASTGWYRIHTPEHGAPDSVTLARVGREPGAISRIDTALLNQAIVAAARAR